MIDGCSVEAAGNEKNGLLLEGAWLEEEIRSKADVIKEFPRETLHFGAIVIVSIKGFEKDTSEWKIKGRIVFRGDAVILQHLLQVPLQR